MYYIQVNTPILVNWNSSTVCLLLFLENYKLKDNPTYIFYVYLMIQLYANKLYTYELDVGNPEWFQPNTMRLKFYDTQWW